MSFLCVLVPQETSRLLSEFDVPGKKEQKATLHITLFYFGEDVPIDKITKIIKITYETLLDVAPFTVQTNKITYFPKGDDGFPIICPIKSDDLVNLRNKLLKAYKKNKIEFNNKFPDYKPHVCLSYAKDENEKDIKSIECKIKDIKWGAHEVTLFAGEHEGKDRLVVKFPLTINESEKRKKALAQICEIIKQNI